MRPTAVWLAAILACASESHGSLKAEQFQFLAYDCSNPAKLKSVSPPELKACETTPQGDKVVTKTYNLLQRADYVRTKATACQVTRTRLGFFCGAYSHQTFVPMASQFEEPIKITGEQCAMMQYTQKYDIGGTKYDIQPDTPNIINVETVGTTEFTYTDVTCYGGDWVDNGRTRKGLNIFESYTVLVQRVEVMVDSDDKVIVANTQSELPCPFGKEECEFVGGSTYVWRYLSGRARCPYYQVRRVAGKEVKGEDGRTVFMSTDGSMTRVVRKSPKTACDQPIFTTNYHKLFLTEVLDDHVLNRPLHLAEMSVTTYSNNKDEFLYGQLTNYVNEEFAAVLQEDCRRQRARRLVDFPGIAAEQAAVSDGETASLGHGYFVTASGEGWYKYQCVHILTTAREDKDCWAGLPVTLTDADRNRYIAQRHEAGYDDINSGNGTEFFIEPHTRRLTSVGVPMPCVRYLAPVYEDTKGRWIRVAPEIELADPPEELEWDKFKEISAANPAHFDFEAGGIYEAEAIRAMDRFNQAPRRQKELNSAMVIMRGGGDGGNGRYSPHDLFPQIPNVDFDLWGKFWNWVDRYGRVLSLFLLTVTIFKVITTIAGFLFRCHTARRHRGSLMAIVLACFPSALHSVLDRVVDLRWLQSGRDAPATAPERGGRDGEGSNGDDDEHPHAAARRALSRVPLPRDVPLPARRLERRQSSIELQEISSGDDVTPARREKKDIAAAAAAEGK